MRGRGIKVLDKVNAFIRGSRDYYRPDVKQLLDHIQGDIIRSITIYRVPLDEKKIIAMNALSLGEFDRRIKNEPYDKLMHLAMIIQTTKGKYVVEKLHYVNVSTQIPASINAETIQVSPIPNCDIPTLLDNAIKKYGKNRIFHYSAHSMNCQQFVVDVLESNGILSNTYMAFVKQNLTNIFEGHIGSIAKKVVDNATDLLTRADIIANGGGINNNRKIERKRAIQKAIMQSCGEVVTE